MGKDVITVAGVEKAYGRNRVLTGIDFAVQEGECFALMGRNGTGKTTLVNMMMGILAPDRGTIRIFETDPLACADGFIRGVSFVSERRGLFPWLTVGRAIAYARSLNPFWDTDEETKLVSHLKIRRELKCGTLSKGEQGKLNLLIALASKPRLLIMDEPTSGLDPYVRRLLFEGIISLMLDTGKTVFYVTHELHEAQRLARKVAFIKDGTVYLESVQDTLRQRHRRIEARLAPDFELPDIPGIMNMRRYSDRVFMDIPEWNQDVEAAVRCAGFDRIEIQPASLEDIFCMHLGDGEVMQ